MPFYAVCLLDQSVNTPELLLLVTGAQNSCRVVSVMANMAGATAGSTRIAVQTYGTLATIGGTPITPAQRDPNSVAARTSAWAPGTAGIGTLIREVAFAVPGEGGLGGWLGNDPDATMFLPPNGLAGGNGNVIIASTSALTATTLDVTTEFDERIGE